MSHHAWRGHTHMSQTKSISKNQAHATASACLVLKPHTTAFDCLKVTFQQNINKRLCVSHVFTGPCVHAKITCNSTSGCTCQFLKFCMH